MKRFLITFCPYSPSNIGALLRTASKIVEDLQASKMPCRLVQPPAPWQIAIEGEGEPDYIRRQILDICDKGEGTAIFKELSVF